MKYHDYIFNNTRYSRFHDLLDKYLLSAYYVPVTVLGTEDTMVPVADKILPSHTLLSLLGPQTLNK